VKAGFDEGEEGEEECEDSGGGVGMGFPPGRRCVAVRKSNRTNRIFKLAKIATITVKSALWRKTRHTRLVLAARRRKSGARS
jgi:hypothetical protein